MEWSAGLLLVAAALSGCAELIELDQTPGRGSVAVTWSVAASAGANFASRVAEVKATVRRGADDAAMATATSSSTAGGSGLLHLDNVTPGMPLLVEVTGATFAGEVIYKGRAELAPLEAAGEGRASIVMNGLPATQILETVGSAGDIVIVYTLVDPESDPCSLYVEYAGGNHGPFFDVASTDSASTQNVSPGEALSFVWHSAAAADEAQSRGSIRLRVTPTDSELGFGSESPPFFVDNETPFSATLTINDGDLFTTSTRVTARLSGKGISTAYLSETTDFSAATPIDAPEGKDLVFDFSSGDGTKTLRARLLSPNIVDGGETIVAATITLDSTPPSGTSVELQGGVAVTSERRPFLLFAATGADFVTLGRTADLSDGVRLPFTTLLAFELLPTGSTAQAAQVTLYYSFADNAGNRAPDPAAALEVLFDAIAPLAPALGSASVAGSDATLTWSAPATPPVTGSPPPEALETSSFQLQVSTATSFSSLAAEAVVADLGTTVSVADGSYHWRVRARDAAGNFGPWASSAAPFVVDRTPPEAPVPSAGAAVVGTATPTLSWSSPTGAVSYDVEVKDAGGAVVHSATVTTPSYQTPALPEGTYSWSVRAADALDNQSSYSAPSSVIVDTTSPPVPSLTQVATPRSASVVSFDWTAVLDAPRCTDAAPPLCGISYRFQIASATTFASNTLVLDSELADPSIAWTPPSNGGTFYYRVRASDAAGRASAYAAYGTVVIDTIPPSSPLLREFSPRVTSDTTPKIAWTPVGVDVHEFHIQVATDLSFDPDPTITVIDEVVSSQNPQNPLREWTPATALDGTVPTEYIARIAARDRAGNESAFSLPESFLLDASAPAAPTGCLIAAGECSGDCSSVNKATPRFRWDAPADEVAHYELQIFASPSGTLLRTQVVANVLDGDGAVSTIIDPAFNTGAYELRLWAVDQTGARSASGATCGVPGSSIVNIDVDVVVAWSVAGAALVDFTGRVDEVRASLRESVGAAPLATASTTSLTSGGGVLSLGELPSGDFFLIEVTGHNFSGEVIYRGQDTLVLTDPSAQGSATVVMNGLPATQIIQTRGSAGDIVVEYTLQDPENDPCDLYVEYAGGNHGPFFDAASVDAASVTAVTPGRNLQVVWRSSDATDEAGNRATVRLRITPTDSELGFASESSSFFVDNETPFAATLRIEGGASFTASSTVDLVLSGAGISAAYFSETTDFTGATRHDYPAGEVIAFGLSASDGDKTIHARLLSPNLATGEAVISATITLDTTPPSNLSIGLLDGGTVTRERRPLFSLDATGASSVAIGKTATLSDATTVPYTTLLAYELLPPSTTQAAEVTLYYAFIDSAGNRAPDPAGSLALLFDAIAPLGPTLQAPVLAGGDVTLSWTAPAEPVIAGAPAAALTTAAYELEVSPNNTFASTVVDLEVGGTAQTLALGDGSYFWRVRAVDAAGNLGQWVSSTGAFVIDTLPPDVPVPVSSGALVGSATPTLSWSSEAASGAVRYELTLSGTIGSLTESVTETSYQTPTLGEGTHQWDVRAIDAAGNASAVSPLESFVVDLTSPPQPELTVVASPRNASVVSFDWQPVVDAPRCSESFSADCGIFYRFQIASATTFAAASLVVDETLDTTTFGWTPPSSGGTFYYRVRASDAAGLSSAYTTAKTVVIDTTPPSPPLLRAFVPSITNDASPTVKWVPVGVDVREFHIQIANDLSFGPSATSIDTFIDSVDPANPLREWAATPDLFGFMPTEYWVRIAARDAAGNESAFSLPESFLLDAVPPNQPGACVIDPGQCSGCTYLNTATPRFSWPAPADEVDHYELEVYSTLDPTIRLRNQMVPVVVQADLRVAAVIDPPLPTGNYELRLWAVDQTGARSTGYNACQIDFTSFVRIDVDAPPRPTIVGAHVFLQDQDASNGEVQPTLYFVPGTATAGPNQSPLLGYYFEVRDFLGLDPVVCGLAVDQGPTWSPISFCMAATSPASLPQVGFQCPPSPSLSDPCFMTHPARLQGGDGTTFTFTVRAIDAAGNLSEAALVPASSPGAPPRDQVLADAKPPASAVPGEPTFCGWPDPPYTRLGGDASGEPNVTFEWTALSPRPEAYLLVVGGNTLAPGFGCDYQLKTQDFGSGFQETRLCHRESAACVCDPNPPEICLRPPVLSSGFCEPIFEVKLGWSCDGGSCVYQQLIEDPTATSATALMPSTENPIRWRVYGIDAAGNRMFPVDLDFYNPPLECGGGFEKHTDFLVDVVPPQDPPNVMGPTSGEQISAAQPTLCFDYMQPVEPDTRFAIEVARYDGISFSSVFYEDDIAFQPCTSPPCNYSCSSGACGCPGSTFTLSQALPDDDYFWRVLAHDDLFNRGLWQPCLGGAGSTDPDDCEWSANPSGQGAFRIIGGSAGETLQAPSPLWPPSASTACDMPELAWTREELADSYELEVYELVSGSRILPQPWESDLFVPQSGGTPSMPVPFSLSHQTWYYFRVRSRAADGTLTTWSAASTFKADATVAQPCGFPP